MARITGSWICNGILIMIISTLSLGNRVSNESNAYTNEEDYYDDNEEEAVNELELQRRQLLQQAAPPPSLFPPSFYSSLLQRGQTNPQANAASQASFSPIPVSSGRTAWVHPMANGIPVNSNFANPQKLVVFPGNPGNDQKPNHAIPSGGFRPPAVQPLHFLQQPSKPAQPQPTRGADTGSSQPKETIPWSSKPQQMFATYQNSNGQPGGRLIIMPSHSGANALTPGRGPPTGDTHLSSRSPQSIYHPQAQVVPTAQIKRPPFYPQSKLITTPVDTAATQISTPAQSGFTLPALAPQPYSPPQQAIQSAQMPRGLSNPQVPLLNIHPSQHAGLSHISNPNLTKPRLIPSVPNGADTIAVSSKPAAPLPSQEPAVQGTGAGKPVGIHTPHGKLVLEPYFDNFCDTRQYSDDVLSSRNLQRVEYFVANLTCSRYFFECAVGQTFLLNCTSKDQVFDINTVNCNFKYNVKTCMEYDHVLHCTIREECEADEFACCSPPQQCIPFAKRCDGTVDCADGDDENNCPACDAGEFPCVKSGKCIPWEKRCNGIPDECFDQTNLDEHNCGSCPGEKFSCAKPSESYPYNPICIEPNLRCNGVKDCPKGEDELNCKSKGKRYLLCENQKQSVSKDQWCDGYEDCLDGSDEKYCIY